MTERAAPGSPRSRSTLLTVSTARIVLDPGRAIEHLGDANRQCRQDTWAERATRSLLPWRPTPAPAATARTLSAAH